MGRSFFIATVSLLTANTSGNRAKTNHKGTAMENTITNRQIFFILLLTLTCYTAVSISKVMAEAAGTGAWLTILATTLVFALAAACVVYVSNKYRGQMLLSYAPSLITKPGAYVLAFFYIIYFLFIVVLLVTDFSKLLVADFFPRTPVWAFSLLGIPLFSYIAYKGVRNTARMAEIIGIVFIFTAVFVHILMVAEGRVNRILPLFNPEETGRYIAAIEKSIFSFLGIEVLFVFPLSPQITKKPVRTAFLSLVAVGLFYVLVVESCIMKLGIHDVKNYNDALVVAIRDTSPQFLEIISRLDILYLTVGFAGIFTGISIAILAVVEYVCRIFRNVSRLAVVISVGAATFALSIIAEGIKGYEEFAEGLGTYLGIFAALVVPFTLFIITKFKNKNKKAGGNAS